MTQTATFMPPAISSDGKIRRSKKPTLCSVLKSSGQTTYRSKGKALYCLTLNGRYLIDQSRELIHDDSELCTDDQDLALRFIDQDVAVARAKALAANGYKVGIKLVLFPYR
jgi:hypothetical protein